MSAREGLRSPRAHAWLFAGTLLAALVAAGGMASQRAFFERFVRERVVEPEPALAALIERVRRGDASADDELRGVAREAGAALYGAFLSGDPHQHDDDDGDARLARLLVEADAASVAMRVERTLVAGSALQRLRAVELVLFAPDPAFGPVINRALERGRHRSTERLLARLERARAALASE